MAPGPVDRSAQAVAPAGRVAMTRFDEACAMLETALTGTFRRDIVADVANAKDFRAALLRLRDSMRSHTWKAGEHQISLGRIIKTFDSLTRDDGFHVLHDWDGKADTVNEDIIPVDVLHYLIDTRGDDAVDRTALAILLDYYVLHLLALLSLRIWDNGDADANLDRLNQLLCELQGSNGSGQRFVDNAETLILIATSHFELHERGYEKLLERTRTLNDAHRTNIALGTLMREYARMQDEGVTGHGRDMLVEAMLNGLTPDARAFVGEPPASLSSCDAERSEFRERFHRYREDLIDAFERHRPSEQAYSPIAFFFNFSHNILKGTVVDALLRSEVWDVSFTDLLSGIPRGEPIAQSTERLANSLRGDARSNPATIRGRLRPVILYDPPAGYQ